MILVSDLREGSENSTQLEFNLFAIVPVPSKNPSGTLKKRKKVRVKQSEDFSNITPLFNIEMF